MRGFLRSRKIDLSVRAKVSKYKVKQSSSVSFNIGFFEKMPPRFGLGLTASLSETNQLHKTEQIRQKVRASLME